MPTSAPVLLELLKQVIDPEVGVNIVALGLIYRLEHTTNGVEVDLTMTSPACPMGESIVAEVEETLLAHLPPSIPVQVNLVWEPAWTPARMTEQARSALGWEI